MQKEVPTAYPKTVIQKLPEETEKTWTASLLAQVRTGVLQNASQSLCHSTSSIDSARSLHKYSTYIYVLN